MSIDLTFRRLSLRARLISSYLVILGIGGLATSLIGSWIVSSTIFTQAVRGVDNNLATARLLYDTQLEDLRRTVQLAAGGTTITRYLAEKDTPRLRRYVEAVRRDGNCEFLSLADLRGRVVMRSTGPATLYDNVAQISVVRAALSGTAAAGTEILPADLLDREDPALGERAITRLVNTPGATPFDRADEQSGMVLIAAAPVRGDQDRIVGALYGGILLNRNYSIVDRVADLVLRDRRAQMEELGNVTVFQNNFRISTSIRLSNGERAVGTRMAPEAERNVLSTGQPWHGVALVVNERHLSRYDPIRSYEGKLVGVLAAGLLERTYVSTRNRVILSFFAVAIIGFICIIGITYYMIRSITRPIGDMVKATQSIAAGCFDLEVPSESQGEIAQLAVSFNVMLKSLRHMRADLEEWGRTLEQKVTQRSEELVAMQARVAQSERLASLGLLAAGVAHEINNPLGAILALTALTLEDIQPDDPNRENLEEALRQSVRCRGIVKGLLDFSRQSKGNMEPLDLNQLIRDTLFLVAKQALFLNIRTVERLDPNLPHVTGDRSQLQQVFINLFINAVQAMGERGAITIESRAGAAGSVEVSVSDTGRGIPPDQLDRIFDPFFTTKESGRGTGLGLSIAYGIVTTHRGSISVQSEVDVGTTFTIRLPAAEPTCDATPPSAGVAHE